jgi:hypothetical protein
MKTTTYTYETRQGYSNQLHIDGDCLGVVACNRVKDESTTALNVWVLLSAEVRKRRRGGKSKHTHFAVGYTAAGIGSQGWIGNVLNRSYR